MERINYYPLGSVVLLDGGIQKLLITSRGLIVNQDGEEVFYDYAGVPYPDGLVSDTIAYFNHDGIVKVVFEGYHDDDDEVIVNNINRFLENNPDIKRAQNNAN